MCPQSTQDDFAGDTNSFYRRTIHVLSDASVPFLVGGSHALLHYTGIERSTKDMDLFVRRADVERGLQALAEAGYRTDLAFPHWLGKAHYGDDFADLIFSSGNGVCVVDDAWFEHAVEAEVLGMPVKLAPPEEFLWQKAFLMERERYDGADVMHLLHACADRLDWDRIMRRFDRYWQLLYSYLVLYAFVYPSDVARIPAAVMAELRTRLGAQLESPPLDDLVCQGTLVSRQQYLVDIGRWGYRDARLAPRGTLTPEETIYWTWAIDHIA